MALILFWIFSTSRPKPRALLATALLCAAFLAPWYAYQLRVHPQWFWAENVQSQLLGTGLHWDRNSPIRSLPVMYYLQRLLQMDPAALLLALAGFAGVFGMRKNPAALLALAWAAVYSTAAASKCLKRWATDGWVRKVKHGRYVRTAKFPATVIPAE